MKKIALLALLPATLLMASCSSTGGGFWGEESGQSEYNYQHQMADGQYPQSAKYIAHDGSVRTYNRPRQYNITNQDINKYNAINDRIAKRRAQIQQQSSSVHMDSTNPANAQSVRPTPSNGSYNSVGETNY